MMAPSEHNPTLLGFVLAGYAAGDQDAQDLQLVPVLSDSAENAIDAVRTSRPGFLLGGLLTEPMLIDYERQIAALRQKERDPTRVGYVVAGYVGLSTNSETAVMAVVLAATKESAIEKAIADRPALQVAGVMSEELIRSQLQNITALRQQGATTH